MTTLSPLRRYAPPLVLIGVTAAFVAIAFGLPPVSRTVPILVGCVTLVLLVLDLLTRTGTPLGVLLRRTLNPDCAEATGRVEEETPLASEIVAILWIAGFTALIMLVGFYAAIPVYMAAYMIVRGRFGFLKTAVITACFTLGIWGLFGLGLDYRLYGGILFS